MNVEKQDSQFLSSMASRSLEEDAVQIIKDEDSEGILRSYPSRENS